MKIKLLLMSLLFFVEIGFAQNSVTYSSKSGTVTTNSGVEGSLDIVISCYGNSGNPVILNQHFLCGDPDGFVSNLASNGLSLIPGQTTTLKFKFKKTVTSDTQKVYKFTTNGSCFQNESEMIKITVNFKVAPTTPTGPAFVNEIRVYNDYNNPSTSLSLNEGSVCPEINGIIVGVSGYEFQWEKKDSNGVWTSIPGGVSENFFGSILLETTKYRRIAKKYGSSTVSTSNEVTINVIPAPVLQNNVISLSGNELQGSLPTGGTGKYVYYWYAYVLEGEDPLLIGQSVNCTVPISVYNFVDFMGYNGYINRVVTSGKQYSTSNTVIIPVTKEITNNVITVSGQNIIGSLPTGGNGDFRYEYYAYMVYDNGEIVEEPSLIGNERHYTKTLPRNLNIRYFRTVISANKSTTSNNVTIPLSQALAGKNSLVESNTSGLTVYPNPASESVNFLTNFSENTEIEIVVYSDKLGNEKSVFKGTITPNQVVNWNIPASYQKGIYFYKILSGNKEVKTGKIIIQ